MSESRKGRFKKKPSPPKSDEGRMPLADHLRELRNRLMKSVLALLVLSIVGWFVYNDVISLLTEPACSLDTVRGVGRPTKSCGNGWLVMQGVLTPFSFQLKLAFIIGLVLASPVWSFQIWAFVAPGLYAKEKRYGLGFVGAGVPLFLGGIALCYWMLPKALGILAGFTPEAFASTLPADEYLDFVIRIFLVFGLAFELPVLLVALNFIGVLTGKRLMGWWRPAIIIIFVFAAVATPTGDPFTMCALALPIVVLYFVAAGISLANDRRKRRADPFRNLDDDEAAELDDDYVYNDDDNDDAPSGSVTAADVDEPEDLDEPLPAQRSKASAKSLRSRYADDDIT